jgi:hypothetical protein
MHQDSMCGPVGALGEFIVGMRVRRFGQVTTRVHHLHGFFFTSLFISSTHAVLVLYFKETITRDLYGPFLTVCFQSVTPRFLQRL